MPLYLGNTKIDKFTVKIEGGAASLEGNLTVITPPTKLVYDVGDSFDPRGMKVIATIGGLEVPVGSYTISPDPLVVGTTEVVLTYELDGKTATGSQSITVNNADTTLENNSWDVIASIAAQGLGQTYWNIGDTKNVVINDKNYIAKIIGFNIYPLATTDSNYNSTLYNNGSNKANISFLMFTSLGSNVIDDTKMNYAKWAEVAMRNTTLPNYLRQFPTELQDNLRTVSIYSHLDWGSRRPYAQSNDNLFLPSRYEIQVTQGEDWDYQYLCKFPYYVQGNAFGLPEIWTRDRDDVDQLAQWTAINALTSSISASGRASRDATCPIFNL